MKVTEVKQRDVLIANQPHHWVEVRYSYDDKVRSFLHRGEASKCVREYCNAIQK